MSQKVISQETQENISQDTARYIPLYRKYRPKNLHEVVGQDHIKKALTNTINLSKISHAYLFTGPRGTGKTSIARILAKSLNCKEGPTLTPCEVCPSCIDIKNSTPMDVIEIDAASNRKVEDARNILEKIQYIPTSGKFKIYIIDEVHMLTKEAFNTLLKTLEEPPENVIFILATTEPQKVLETITSRCQRFDFRRITTDDIINHLKHIAKLEKIKIDNDALFTIAKNAAGGMRDSLALLDQVSVLDGDKTITSDDVNKLLGRISFDMLHKLSENIIQSKPQGAIELLEKIYNSGNEPSQILINMMGYLKNLLIIKNCQGDELLIDLTQLNNSQIQILKKQSENIETHQITFLIEKTIYYIKELKTTTNQHLWLEIAIIDLANLAQNTSLLELQERVSKLENNTSHVVQPFYVSKPVPVATPVREEKSIIVSEGTPVKEDTEAKCKMQNAKSGDTAREDTAPVSLQEASLASDEAIQNDLPQINPPTSEEVDSTSNLNMGGLWIELLKNISSTPTVSLLDQHARPLEITEEKVVIGCKENFLKMLNSEGKKPFIDEGARKLFNKPVSVVIKVASAEEFLTDQKKKLTVEKANQEAKRQRGKEAKQDEVPGLEEQDEDTDFIEHELSKKTKKEEKFAPSDQVSMIMNLLDGKYIES